jgi:hypothetical protein
VISGRRGAAEAERTDELGENIGGDEVEVVRLLDQGDQGTDAQLDHILINVGTKGSMSPLGCFAQLVGLRWPYLVAQNVFG